MDTRQETSYDASRREFLRTVARLGALGTLGGVAVACRLRGRDERPEGACVGEGLCNACCLLADCRLPLAVETKQRQQ